MKLLLTDKPKQSVRHVYRRKTMAPSIATIPRRLVVYPYTMLSEVLHNIKVRAIWLLPTLLLYILVNDVHSRDAAMFTLTHPWTLIVEEFTNEFTVDFSTNVSVPVLWVSIVLTCVGVVVMCLTAYLKTNVAGNRQTSGTINSSNYDEEDDDVVDWK